MGSWRCLLLLPLLLAPARRAQQQHFMEYVERRLTLLEQGISQLSLAQGPSSPQLPGRGTRVLCFSKGSLCCLWHQGDFGVPPGMGAFAGQMPEGWGVTAVRGGSSSFCRARGAPGKPPGPQGCPTPADCSDTIASVRAMKILKRFGSSSGLWTKDAVGSSEKIYVFDGTANDTVYVFPRMREFTLFSATRKAARIKLPYPWVGTGHLVYDGHLYYIRQQGPSFQVIKFNLANKTVVDSSVFPAEEQIPVFGLSPFTYIEVAADEEGLWAVYATKEDEKNICLAKLDPGSLDIEQMWDTPCPRENAEGAFVVCGALHVVYNTRLPSRSRVQCVFDVSGTLAPEDASLVYFPKRYGSHASLKYSPRERQLYAWDDGYQIIYRMEMKKKTEV
ncbi:OLFL3 protein, partial [Furnarius figulus]|nr:OLFL3 protein [Furnarius figulus]